MILKRTFIFEYVKKVWRTLSSSIIIGTWNYSHVTTLVVFLVIGVYGALYSYLLLNKVWTKVSPSVLSPHDNNNVTCHYSTEGDSLPDSFDVINSEDKNIFFVETSCQGGLNSRQACAVESAARRNPEWQINLIFAGPVSAQKLNHSVLTNLVAMHNVKVSRALLSRLVKETSTLEVKDLLQRSKFRVSHASDVYRYLILYKYPGVYLDLDMIVARPFGTLARDFASREHTLVIASWALGFSSSPTGRKMARITKVEIRRTFTPDVWGSNGPGVVTRALKQFCLPKYSNTPSQWHAGVCQGFEIYDIGYFSPNLAYFNEDAKYFGIAYTHHFYNKMTHDKHVKNTSLYMKLAREYCPTVCKIYGPRFGL